MTTLKLRKCRISLIYAAISAFKAESNERSITDNFSHKNSYIFVLGIVDFMLTKIHLLLSFDGSNKNMLTIYY